MAKKTKAEELIGGDIQIEIAILDEHKKVKLTDTVGDFADKIVAGVKAGAPKTEAIMIIHALILRLRDEAEELESHLTNWQAANYWRSSSEQQPVEAAFRCRECGAEFEYSNPDTNGCPECGSQDLQAI